MKCGYPVTVGNKIVPCGRCMPCRINAKRMWTGRILMETTAYNNIFIFLIMTYDEEYKLYDDSLSFCDFYDYINRLRNSSLGYFRFFAVGEYGDKIARPYYHMAIFNCPPEKWESRFNESWPHGFIQAGEVTRQSAGYIAGYCTKKMTDKDDERLNGRVPEFSRMSKKPPLGAIGMRRIRDMMFGRKGSEILAKLGDVPSSFWMEGKIYPIGRYWRKWLQNEVGVKMLTDKYWEADINEIMNEEQEAARGIVVKFFRW